MLSRGSLIYLIVLSSVFLILLLYGNKKVYDNTDKISGHMLYSVILLTVYIIFLGIHFMHWSLENIFIMILVASVLLSIISFLIIYFSKSVCTKAEKDYSGFILTFLEITVIILALYDRTNYTSWTIYDVVRFILTLVLIRIMYYLTKRYNKPLYKTVTDITLVLVIYLYGNRLYRINRQIN